jgi:hypothetical protein
MKRFLPLAIAALAFAAHAITVTATLVGSRVGTSVGGQSIVICTYTYSGQNFEKVFPLGTSCPISIQLQ